jgi:hypothetical protein
MEAAQFLRDLILAVPYFIHTVLTDNGIQFTPRKQDIWGGQHIFDRVCDEHAIEHRLTKVNHPWTTGQVERMNRRSRTPPSSATPTTATTSSGPICSCSWTPTTMLAGSRPCVA